MWRLELPYERPPFTLNQRLHYQQRAKVVRAIRDDTMRLARAAKLPRGLDHVTVILYWQVPDKRHRDTDNPVPTHKAIVDGLTEYGLTEYDSMDYVTGVMPQIVRVPKAPFRMWVDIHHGNIMKLLAELESPL